MYQFTTTNVINSTLDSNGVTPKFVGANETLTVSRVGKFAKADIISLTKRAYYPGVLEVAKVTVPVITAGLVARLELDIRLSQQTDSEYANTYLYFKKPVFVEVIATGNATTDATALKNALNAMKATYGFQYVVATSSGADITVTAVNVNQRFWDIKILKEATSYNSIIQPEYTDVTAGTFAVTVVGRVGFGDNDWMARKVMLPTAENVRYFGISKDERPILGGNYTEYVLKYKIQKDPSEGIVAEGYSVTTHVFYVLSDLVTAWEQELTDATITYTNVFGGGVIVISGTASLANSATSQLTANGAVGAVTWSVVSGTSATVSGTGLVTAHGTIDGATVVKALDSEGTAATYTITVA